MENKMFNISPAPHVKSKNSVNVIMLDFIIALLPVLGAAYYFYGVESLILVGASVATCVVTEGLWDILVRKRKYVTEISSIFNGLLVGLILPVHVPVWIAIIGALFATVVCKLIFGGLGQNFMHPAAATKAFLIASWAAVMAKPVVVEAVSAASGSATATPEVQLTLIDKIIGQASGNIGEASILAMLIGGLYLVLRGRISLRAPLAFIISSFAMYSFLGKEGLLPGAFFFAAIFMATDYATSPMTKVGQYIYGIGLGVVASVIAVLGYNPEGPYYAIIIMNLTTPLIEYFTTKRYKKEAV